MFEDFDEDETPQHKVIPEEKQMPRSGRYNPQSISPEKITMAKNRKKNSNSPVERGRLSFAQDKPGNNLRESLEIIEDAEVIEEEEADSSINHSEDHVPQLT